VTRAPSIDAPAVAALLARCRGDVDDGLLPSCQLALARHGELIVDETFGAGGSERYVTFSITKAMSASLAWLLIGDGRLTDRTRVAEVVPEFAANGKDAVTVEHLLTHTAGFPRAPMRPEEGADRAVRVERMAGWRLDWPAGSQTAYHATSAYWPLVEMVERIYGSDFRKVFADRVAAPLGLTTLTLGSDSAIGVQPVVAVGFSADADSPDGRDLGEMADRFLLRFNEPAVLAVGVPGAGAVSRAADVAAFYQALLGDDGPWETATRKDATTNVRNRMVDPLYRVPANRTLGLMVAGDDGHAVVRGFGRHCGPRTFGAPGVGGQIAWADPDSGLSFCYLTNGMDADVVASFTRSAKIAGLAARCVRPT
jgi:CubicO group peptidase (beta-lactamase class C family)